MLPSSPEAASATAGLYVGLMSGTSLDGVDGVLVEFDAEGRLGPAHRARVHRPYEATLRTELLALNTPGADEIHRSALAANALVRTYAAVVEERSSTGTRRSAIRAIGAHGQTLRHRPGAYDGTGYTVQLNQPALLAETTGIDVIADFRSRDVAAGGQGAPLVPAVHQALFARPGTTICVLNLGGISNVTVLGADGRVTGFDCGPGNVLLDLWCQQHRGLNFDEGGQWGASGRVLKPLLARMRQDPFFAAPPPRSTGRDLFNASMGRCMPRRRPGSGRSRRRSGNLGGTYGTSLCRRDPCARARHPRTARLRRWGTQRPSNGTPSPDA